MIAVFNRETVAKKGINQLSLMVGICRNCELSYNEATVKRCKMHAFFAVAKLLVINIIVYNRMFIVRCLGLLMIL